MQCCARSFVDGIVLMEWILHTLPDEDELIIKNKEEQHKSIKVPDKAVVTFRHIMDEDLNCY
jgi:hypothetical protein